MPVLALTLDRSSRNIKGGIVMASTHLFGRGREPAAYSRVVVGGECARSSPETGLALVCPSPVASCDEIVMRRGRPGGRVGSSPGTPGVDVRAGKPKSAAALRSGGRGAGLCDLGVERRLDRGPDHCLGSTRSEHVSSDRHGEPARWRTPGPGGTARTPRSSGPAPSG